MRKLLWLILLFTAYVWVMTSGRDRMVLEQGKAVYNALVAWLDDAEIDYQVKKEKKPKKRARRWD
jgi:hypothetical protein